MARIVKGGLHPRGEGDLFPIFRRDLEEAQGVEDVGGGIERKLLAPVMGLVEGMLRQDMGRIHHHDGGEVPGGRGRDDRPPKAILDEERKASAMIEVGMGQKNRRDLLRIEAEGLAVLVAHVVVSLKHPAVHEKLMASGTDLVAGARHAPGRSVKSDLHGFSLRVIFSGQV